MVYTAPAGPGQLAACAGPATAVRSRPPRLLDDDAGEFDAGGDAELAEGLPEVVGHRVGADVQVSASA